LKSFKPASFVVRSVQTAGGVANQDSLSKSNSPNLRRSKETLLSRPANSGLAIVLRVDRFNLLLGIYVRHVKYGPVYGGLAAAIGLMVWMEFSALIVFVGAAWNAEGESSPSNKKEGQQSITGP